MDLQQNVVIATTHATSGAAVQSMDQATRDGFNSTYRGLLDQLNEKKKAHIKFDFGNELKLYERDHELDTIGFFRVCIHAKPAKCQGCGRASGARPYAVCEHTDARLVRALLKPCAVHERCRTCASEHASTDRLSEGVDRREQLPAVL